MTELNLSSLNETQRQAVEWQEGSLLVLAGPGSGKTRVLIYRIARLVLETPDSHFRVLGLTFTNKAATEMRERINALVANAGDRILLSTFHSFAGDILRQHGHLIGLRPDFTILTQDSERASLLDDIISENSEDFEDCEYKGEKLLPLINRLLDYAADERNLPQFMSTLNQEDQKPIKALYLAYRRLMIKRNTLDFGGLMAEALGLLRQREAVRKQIQRVYTYVCVDEFQDTNSCQYQLLRELVNPVSYNLFVVADDDQIIYQWNGASPERLGTLKKDFNMALLQLPENYRCPSEVIDLANRLIVHNSNRSTEKQALKARKKAGLSSAIRLIPPFRTFEDEAVWVAEDILTKIPTERTKCVVLARTKKLLDTVVEKLTEKSVPAYLAMRKDEFVSEPMRWLHSVLRLANARQDREQLRRVCKAFFSLEGIDLDVKDIASIATTMNGDYLRAFMQAALSRDELEKPTQTFVQKSISKISDRLDFRSFAVDTFKWFEAIPETMPNADDVFSEYPQEKETWETLLKEIDGQFGAEQVTLNLLLQELDMRSKAPKPPAGAMPCFTIHAAKGMEFNHVYLVGLVEDQLPSWAAVKKGDDSREMQEERRNCFVAITRTQETLTLSYSQKVQGWGKQPSRFLKEMGLL